MRTIVAGLMMTTAAGAADISGEVAKCYNPVPGSPDIQAVLEISLSQNGHVADISVRSFQPETDAAEDAVRGVSLAIERCAPYEESGSATVTVPLPDAKPIDPFD